MWSAFKIVYNTFFYEPLLNGLLFLTNILPGYDLGLAIIVLTILIRTILFPLNHRMIKTQRAMKMIEPEIKKIQKEITKKEEQGKALMGLYKAHGINPFAGFFALLIQLPLLIALFQVFQKDILSQTDLVYSFITIPNPIHTLFLGFIELTKPSYFVAAIAAVSQFFQAKLAMPPKTNEKPSDFSAIMQKQMVYMFPVMIFIFSVKLPSAVSLYWTVMNVFAIVHEAIVRKKAEKIGRSM